MRRHDQWPKLLVDFIEERRCMPFAWGINDCCLFASDWVRVCTGIDPAAGIRGKYCTALGAARILKNHGGVRGIMHNIAEPLGIHRIAGGLDQRGDLAVAETGNGESIGICIGAHAAFVGVSGLLFAPFDFKKAAHCWRV